MRYFFSFSILVLAALGLQNCGNPYAGYGDRDYNGRSRGTIPFSNNSINSFRSMVNNFDSLGSGDLAGFDPDDLRNQEFYGPLMKDIIEETDPESPLYCQDNCLFARVVVNMGANDIFSEKALGSATIFVTDNQYTEQGGDISTLVLPNGFKPEDYEGSYRLDRNLSNFDRDNDEYPSFFSDSNHAIPQGFELQNSGPVSDSCSVLTVGGSAGDLTVHNELVNFDDLDQDQKSLGVSSCPISLTSLDYRNGVTNDFGSINLKIGVEPLPGYQTQNGQSTRWGISSLGNFPFPDFDADSQSALSAEYLFEFRGPNAQKYLLLYHFYYNLYPRRLNRPEELGSYSYLGTFTDPVSGKAHEYYAHHDKVSPKPIDVKRTAILLQTALGASEVYAADPGSAAENNFIRQKLNALDGQTSYLLGFDDCGNQKMFQTARDPSLPRFQSWMGGASTSRYTNWFTATGSWWLKQPNAGTYKKKKKFLGISIGSKYPQASPPHCHVAMRPDGKWTHVDASHRAVVFEVIFGHTSSGSIGSGSSGSGSSGSGSGGTFTGGN